MSEGGFSFRWLTKKGFESWWGVEVREKYLKLIGWYNYSFK